MKIRAGSVGFALVVTGVLVASAACNKNEPSPEPAVPENAPASAPGTTPGTTPAASPSAGAQTSATGEAGKPEVGKPESAKPAQGKMAHCPSAVAGAKTDVKDTPTGVEVIVTGTSNVDEIRARATFLAQAAKTTTPGLHHTGRGEGSGAVGRCPIVLHDTTIDVANVEGGVKVAVAAKDPKELEWLRKETRHRMSELQTPNLAEYGQRKMVNCPSAVAGAKTAVKDAKGAVEVKVTGADETTTKEIRDRAKRLVEASKVDGAQPRHTGTGTGGGAMGNCPVVLKDTNVEAKDVPGGSVLTVRPTKASGFAALKTETATRQENLAKALETH